MRRAKFGNVQNGQKQFWRPPCSFVLGFCNTIINCVLPVHIFHANSLLSQQIEPSNQYSSS